MSIPNPTSTKMGMGPHFVAKYQGGVSAPIPLRGDRHVLGRDNQRADLVLPADWTVISGCQATIQRAGKAYYLYDGDGKQPSRNGMFANHTRITCHEGILLADGLEIQIGQNPSNLVSLTFWSTGDRAAKPKLPNAQSISLRHRSVVLGRDPSATLMLDAPTVSRRHAIIDSNDRGQYVLQDCSTNGVFVNGNKVNRTITLNSGDRIRIGSYLLVINGDELALADTGNRVRLDAYNLVRQVKNKKGESYRILDDISLPIEPGQLVALVGGSGTGKSTLMKTLLGISSTTSGNVFLNGELLRNNFNIYRTQIGYVPQDDIVHYDLTVNEVLTYAAQLRLSPDVNINQAIEQTLGQIEMKEHGNTLVKNLSGGQRKRVSIGVELLADPKLFFLDEPTSGLDPGLDKKMMLLLRKLADQGRTIILVTHATANISLCDRIVFLGKGGKLCYFGAPEDALRYFAHVPPPDQAFLAQVTAPRPEEFPDIYNYLEDRVNVVAEANRFNRPECLYYQRYIATHLTNETRSSGGTPPEQVKRSLWQQLRLLVQRQFQLLMRDGINLGLALLTAPVGIGLIALALGDKDPLILGPEDDPTLAPLALRVLFVFTSAALWVGLSSSLQEIVKEAAIYARERLVNLGLFAYLGSKVVILGGVAIAQALLMTLAILGCFASPETELIPWVASAGITSFLTLFTCMSLGLFISALVNNSAQANSALPLILLPQIIFSGVLFKMEGVAKYISWLMLSRWSVGAYGTLVDVNAMVPEPTQLPDGSLLPQPFEPTTVYDPTWQNLWLNWGILCLHAAIYLAATTAIQKRKDIF
ncbi:MAG: ATP-binding cassette domain-containing protein [Spirulina sp. DLM2.Bin59]|nr:MAG: ATP-binding cassette domain-containing protein [Spirulina sp. DLM2.Bin59]